MKIAFIGLGVMGFPMAGHLSTAGHEVRVFNRTTSKSERWIKAFKGTHHFTAKEAVHGANLAISCVGDDPDVESVVLGQDGILEGLETGAVIVDHTTTSAQLAMRLFETAMAKGVGFVDAPVSGGEAGAQNGQLTIMCGGNKNVCAEETRMISNLLCLSWRFMRVVYAIWASLVLAN